MSHTSGIFSDSSGRSSEIDHCRLCMKNHEYYYNIFSSSVACKITVKDALHDLVGLYIAVGDGLPATMCPLCLKKLTEFSVFKKTCLDSNAFLRKSLTRKCFRSFEREGAVDDNLGPSVETTDCIQDVIENNTQLTCSAQATEIYIPVPDCLLPRDDKLFLVVKEESEGHLSEENNPMLYTSDPAGISSDVSDPLTTDDLSDPVRYKCSPVKEDQISDDEEGHVLNDCSDGVSSKLVHQDSSDQSIGGEGAVQDNLTSSTETKDFAPDVTVSTFEEACSVQPNEIFIPVPDIQLPIANMLDEDMSYPGWLYLWIFIVFLIVLILVWWYFCVIELITVKLDLQISRTRHHGVIYTPVV